MHIAIYMFALALASQAAAGPPQDTKGLEQEMLRLVNIEREARGLSKLETLPELAVVARQHSWKMAERDEVAHEIDGAPPFAKRVRNAVPDACHFGENITKHYTIEYALADLMGSPGHRGNILSPKYTVLGIGIVRNKDGLLYITQDFIAFCKKKEKGKSVKEKARLLPTAHFRF